MSADIILKRADIRKLQDEARVEGYQEALSDFRMIIKTLELRASDNDDQLQILNHLTTTLNTISKSGGYK